MRVKKIFKKEDGTRYEITIGMNTVSYLPGASWTLYCSKCLPGKRKFVSLNDINDYRYRAAENKDAYINNLILSEVDKSWIDEVKKLLIEEINKSFEKFISTK